MKNRLLWLVSVIPLVVTALLLPKLPDRLPMHYDMAGNIDRWGSKYEQFIFPVAILGITLFWQMFLWYFSRRKKRAVDEKEQKEAEANALLLSFVAFGNAILFSVMHFTFLYSAWLEAAEGREKMAIDGNRVVFVCVGVFLLVIGNFLPKARRNSLLGLRTSWSMKNDEAWAASQRFGGKILILAGICMIACALFLQGAELIVVCLLFLAFATAAAVGGSYLVCRKR